MALISSRARFGFNFFDVERLEQFVFAFPPETLAAIGPFVHDFGCVVSRPSDVARVLHELGLGVDQNLYVALESGAVGVLLCRARGGCRFIHSFSSH